METDRYARQKLIEWWDQERLRSASILVAGAGALGNEVLKNLALLGVGQVLVVDFDRIEPSNLSRTGLFRESDIGRPKVEVAGEAVTALNPDVTVETLYGDVFYDVGLGYYRHRTLVIGCLDNLAARSQVGRSCGLAGVPYLDGGIWSLGGEVRWFSTSEGPCFDCMLSAEDREHASERRSCTGFRLVDEQETQHVSTLVTTAAIIAGMLVQEAVKYLCGYPITAGKAIVYNGQVLTLHRAELTRNPRCSSSHSPYQKVIELAAPVTQMTARQLFSLARAALKSDGQGTMEAASAPPGGDQGLSLQLGRDFLLELRCLRCGRAQEVNQHWDKVLEQERICPFCGAARHAEVIRALDEQSLYIDRPLSTLGVPPGEVLAVYAGNDLLLFELGV